MLPHAFRVVLPLGITDQSLNAIAREVQVRTNSVLEASKLLVSSLSIFVALRLSFSAL